MQYCIYQITNNINNKIYIGKHQTSDINDAYFGSGKLIKRAVAKYGLENFSKEILFVFDTEEKMNAKEAELVTEEFCNQKDNYNLCVGGKGGFSYINRKGLNRANFKSVILTPDDIQKRSASVQRWYADPTNKAAIGSAKNKMVETRLKRGYYSTEYKKSLHRKHTEETKRKLSEKAKINSAGNKNSQYGSMWITDGRINKKIKQNAEIPEKFYKGRCK